MVLNVISLPLMVMVGYRYPNHDELLQVFEPWSTYTME